MLPLLLRLGGEAFLDTVPDGAGGDATVVLYRFPELQKSARAAPRRGPLEHISNVFSPLDGPARSLREVRAARACPAVVPSRSAPWHGAARQLCVWRGTCRGLGFDGATVGRFVSDDQGVLELYVASCRVTAWSVLCIWMCSL